MFQPGSVYSGGTWHVEHFAFPLKSALPRRLATSNGCCSAEGAGIFNWYTCKAASLDVVKSGVSRLLPKLFLAAMGNLTASFSRGSQNVPLPCISRFETKAF